MKSSSFIILILLFSVFPAITSASGVIMHAKVSGVYCGIYNGADMCSIYFNKESVSAPSCVSSSYKLRMQLSTKTETGRSMLSLAMTANATGKTVIALGTGTCSIWSDTEDLNSIFLPPKCAESNNTWGCLPS